MSLTREDKLTNKGICLNICLCRKHLRTRSRVGETGESLKGEERLGVGLWRFRLMFFLRRSKGVDCVSRRIRLFYHSKAYLIDSPVERHSTLCFVGTEVVSPSDF